MKPKTMTTLPSQSSTSLVPCHWRTSCFHFYVFPEVLMYEISEAHQHEALHQLGPTGLPLDLPIHETCLFMNQALRETTGIVSWETSPLSWIQQFEAFFSCFSGHILFLLFFFRPSGTRVGLGTWTDLHLATISSAQIEHKARGRVCCLFMPLENCTNISQLRIRQFSLWDPTS